MLHLLDATKVAAMSNLQAELCRSCVPAESHSARKHEKKVRSTILFHIRISLAPKKVGPLGPQDSAQRCSEIDEALGLEQSTLGSRTRQKRGCPTGGCWPTRQG